MSKMKKWLALLLAVVMCMSILAGCGNTEEKPNADAPKENESSNESSNVVEKTDELEPVTLKWYMPVGEKEGSKDVQEAFNAKLAEVLPNTTVEFVYIEDYATNWPLLLAGEEPMDLAWAGYLTNFLQDTMDGSLYAMNDLIANYAPNIQSEMEIWPNSYATANYQGETYGVPCIQPIVIESQRFEIGEQFMEYLDLEAFLAELKNSEKLTAKTLDIIEEAYVAAIASGEFEVGDPSWVCMHGVQAGAMGYLPLGPASYGMWYDPLAENPEPMFYWELPEVKMLMERYGEWCDKGWITDSLMLRQIQDGARHTVSFYEVWNSLPPSKDENGVAFVDNDVTGIPSYYQVEANAPEEAFVGTTIYANELTYVVIPFTSKNPERAMMLLDLMHAEPGTVGNELANMLSYGFEENSEEAAKYGWFNYTAVDVNGELTVDQSTRGDAPSMHSIYNWMLTNTFKTMSDGSANTTKERKEYAMSFYENVYPNFRPTALDGMIVDYAPIESECAAIQSVYNEYLDRVEFGAGASADVEAVYAEIMDKLEQAGLSAVKDELRAQIAAYIG